MACAFVFPRRGGFARFRVADDFRGGMKWIVALPALHAREMAVYESAQRTLVRNDNQQVS
jgi:hypothetical protein